MDARITKQRLANMLSYDWLKIIGAIALAAVAFCVFFMMIATRPTDGQTFYVYAYDGLYVGTDFSRLGNDLKDKNVFAYDILNTGSETFENNSIYGTSAFTARRSAGEGRVMFVNDVRTTDENGKETSTLLSFIDNEGTAAESFRMFLDPEVFIDDCEGYLKKFYGDGLSDALNTEKARASFMERNGKDKRYRTSAKKEAGVLDEFARLEKLKTDFLAVKAAIGEKLDYVRYTGFEGREYRLGFSMNLPDLRSLVYYTVEEEGTEVKTTADIALCIFNNGTREGDLKYETVNFLAYLLRTYGAEK